MSQKNTNTSTSTTISTLITSIIDYILSILNLLRLMIQLKRQGRYVKRNPSWSMLTVWNDRVSRTPHHTFISFLSSSSSSSEKQSSTCHTYRDIDLQSNRLSHILHSHMKKSSSSAPTIALFLSNTPFVITSWIAIAKLGGTASLINANLRGKSLAHAIKTSLLDSSDKVLIVGDGSYFERCWNDEEVRMTLEKLKGVTILIKSRHDTRGVKELTINKIPSVTVSSLDTLLSHAPSTTPTTPLTPPSHHTPLLTIYTSGTTGLPKASIITHLRYWSSGRFLATVTFMSERDRMYCPLPLYHSSGGMMGVGSCVLVGGCLVLREKFSARSFAGDLVSQRCSVILYIGELARFALAAKETKDDDILRRTKSVRAAFGNGMRGDVWEPFRQRFGIGRIYEFYGSTEGNATLINNTTKPYALGFIPPPFTFVYPILLAKTDPLTGTILRDPTTNRVVPAAIGESGQLLGKIQKTDPTRKFEGYTDVHATRKKIVRDVKEKGDEWFLSGDLLRRDVWGFYYWVDRMGDTFRWKGENVSTAEVQEAFTTSNNDNKHNKRHHWQVNVYGVEVNGYEGRTGMARIVLNDDDNGIPFDGATLYDHLDSQLPRYAIPMFLRVARETTMTSTTTTSTSSSSSKSDGDDDDDDVDDEFVTCTFKHKKTDLVKDGFDPKLCQGEVVYWRDDRCRKFVVMAEEDYIGIMTRKIKI